MTAPKYRPPASFGLGGVPLGNEFEFVTDEQAEEVLEAAWEAGVRYFDTSPWYGLGLCERRYGRFLHTKPRGEYILSTKVGKLLKASPANQAKKYFPFTTSPNDPIFDYSGDGVRRSVEDSLQRLGLDRIDMLFVHDLSPDNVWLPESWEELFKVADRCVQILGGIGISDETPVGMIFSDIRAFRLYDGPTEVHKYAIARQVLRP